MKEVVFIALAALMSTTALPQNAIEAYQAMLKKAQAEAGGNEIPDNAEETVIFTSSSNITINSATTTSFADGAYIESITKFGGPIMTVFGGTIPTFVIWVDDEVVALLPFHELLYSQEDHLRIQIFPDAANYKDQLSLNFLNNVLTQLTPGKHTITVGWTGGGQSTKADLGWYGQFELDGDNIAKFQATANKLNEAKLDQVKLPKAAANDAGLEAKFLACTQAHAKAEGWKETFVKCIITSRDWSIERNSLTGVILGRKRSAALCATWPDGHCTYQTFSFYQQYDGANYSSTVRFNGVGSQIKIGCNKFK